ncbi:MAG TPA: ATP-dependent DNA helicase RecG [Myxococcota bacterium]|nr:ATP-dependent DNA helicase RecG [Myxococcota bacterium]
MTAGARQAPRIAASPFAEALEAALRPLRFAAAGDPARAKRVRDLDETVRAALLRASELAIPGETRERLVRLAGELTHAGVSSGEASGADAAQRAARRADLLAELEALAGPGFGERTLARPLDALPGFGPKRAAALARRGLRTYEDLLFHLPARYDDRSQLAKIGELQVGLRATFAGEVLLADPAVRRGPRRVFQAVLGDGTGTVDLKWFRAPPSLASSVKKGARLLVSGEVRRFRFSKELIHPEVELLREGEEAGRHLGVVPDYPAVEGLPPRTLRGAIERVVAETADLVEGHLPPALAQKRKLPALADALRRVHRPDPGEIAELRERRGAAFDRLILEELFLLETGLALRRAAREREPGIPLAPSARDADEAAARLPFRLTSAQARALAEIRADLARPHPMHRLLQGDVGSGKTAVAFLAACAVRHAGHQSALMAPTELLAEQHERTLRRLAGEGSALRIGLLTASVPRARAQALREQARTGELDLLIGTHALVQAEVGFARLALVIVDEQHRFGVLQRAALAGKGGGPAPHQLVMTATPIPRTLAMTVYGDLDVSVIDELPPGRAPVVTDVMRSGEGARVMQTLRETLARGEQAYVVYPLVEETERSDLRAATESAERIAAAFADVGVDLVHGRKDAASRASSMARFEAGDTRILVSTTVIEVGVDVPNATLMIVEHAERFGLAQLHQLRGRVGRGTRRGTCLLVARGGAEDSEARLRALLETQDGFRIAEADLRIRGPGEFLGTRQHGRLPGLRIADLLRDARLIAAAREGALALVRADPALRRSPGLAEAVERRFGERLALAVVG